MYLPREEKYIRTSPTIHKPKIKAMKRTLLALGVLIAAPCGTSASQASLLSFPPNALYTLPSADTADETLPQVGVSIGTVEAQPYSESGLSFSYFGDAEYVAQTAEGTYMGFSVESEWTSDEETGNETEHRYACLVALNSTDEAVTIPDYITVGDETIPVERINGYYNLYCGFTSNVKSLTVPATVNYIYKDYEFDRYLEALYMLGAAPETSYNYMNVAHVYVCSQQHYSSYVNNEYFTNNSTVSPYGWEFDWVTVNVEKSGEFAETYLTQNNYDWGAGIYVKVTGHINATDLSAIKNLTALQKLDLSETSITEVPDYFMQNRASLQEIMMPPTLARLGNYAFSGCTSLQAFDLNGITTIGNSVFNSCNSLQYINLTGVKSIGSSAFSGCTKLKGVDLSTVRSLGSDAFSSCTSLDTLDIRSASSLGSSVFYYCSALKRVNLGDSLQTIPSSAFQGTAIDTIAIPKNVTLIDNNAFYNCQALSSISLNTGLLTIESHAFYGCSSLEEITIPSTLKSIGSSAFNNTAIKKFTCYAVVPPAASSSFIGSGMDMSRTYLYVPPFSKDFYRNTQYWSNFFLMSSIREPIDYIYVDRELTINLEEEDNDVVANNPKMYLTWEADDYYSGNENIGQLTATGEGTLSAGELTIDAELARRSSGSYNQYCPTLINYADKMRADNVKHNLTFYSSSSSQWFFISLPYDVKVSEIVPSANTYWVIRRYDSAARAAGETSATWVNLTNDDVMEAGKGYIVSAVRNTASQYAIGGGSSSNYPTLTFTSGNSLTKNNLFRSTDVIVPLTEYTAEFAHNRSWNLIGNPYPCYFDMHYLNEEFTAPVTVWNGSSYVAYSPVDDDLVLAPYEAFFVQCPLNATEMTFREAGRLHSAAGKELYKAPAREHTAVPTEGRNVFNFTIANETADDRARIVLNPEAKSEYEIGRDAAKFFADGSDCAQLYVSADVCYSIEERPVGDGTATLGLRAAEEGAYTLSLSGKYSPEWHVLLTDNATGRTVDLTKGNYPFTAAAGDAATRFAVTFALNGAQTGISSVVADFGAEANVEVTALSGVKVFAGRAADIQVPAPGIYVVSDGQTSHKVILK